MNEVLGDAITAAMFAGLALLLAYQLFMMYWTKKTAGSIPRIVWVLRITNITLLLVVGALAAYQIATR